MTFNFNYFTSCVTSQNHISNFIFTQNQDIYFLTIQNIELYNTSFKENHTVPKAIKPDFILIIQFNIFQR